MVHSRALGTLRPPGRVRVGNEVEYWVLGGQKPHTSLVPLSLSDVAGAVSGCIGSGRGRRNRGPMRLLMQREDMAEPPDRAGKA